MTKPFIEIPEEEFEYEPEELTVLVTIQISDPALLAHVTQQKHLIQQLEDVFTTNIGADTEGFDVVAVEPLDVELESEV
jgi:hypothetical protein